MFYRIGKHSTKSLVITPSIKTNSKKKRKGKKTNSNENIATLYKSGPKTQRPVIRQPMSQKFMGWTWTLPFVKCILYRRFTTNSRRVRFGSPTHPTFKSLYLAKKLIFPKDPPPPPNYIFRTSRLPPFAERKKLN